MSVRLGMARLLGGKIGFGYSRRAAVAALAATLCGPVAADPAGHDLVAIPAGGGLAAFRIDRHEVTVGQFRAFVTATGTVTTAEREGGGRQYLGGWRTMPGWTWKSPYGAPAAEDEPAAHITFDEAAAYCQWAGLRLPRDAEWVRAAYSETRREPPAPFAAGRTYPYPTGDSPDAANQTASPNAHRRVLTDPRPLGQGHGHVPVRTTAPGVNGLHDMGANLWEWTDGGSGDDKPTRGGSWWYGPAQMRADALYTKPRAFPAVYIGFRCAGD